MNQEINIQEIQAYVDGHKNVLASELQTDYQRAGMPYVYATKIASMDHLERYFESLFPLDLLETLYFNDHAFAKH